MNQEKSNALVPLTTETRASSESGNIMSYNTETSSSENKESVFNSSFPNNTPQNSDTATVSSQFLQFATAYVANGWVPIPVERPVHMQKKSGKKPILKNWQHLQIQDINLESYWKIDIPYNIGLQMGTRSRLVGIDFDNEDALIAWKAKHPGVFEQTMSVKRDNDTSHCHVYFSLSEGQIAPKSENRSANRGVGIA